MNIIQYISDRLPFGHGVDVPGLDAMVERCQTEPWHAYAIRNRWRRRHVCIACKWLAENMPHSAHVFEPGCGSAINLVWLGLKGFSRLSGSDLSESAIMLGKEIGQAKGLNMDLWPDDGLKPARMPENVDAILSVNWLYHIPQASMEGFLEIYDPCLNRGGKIIFDMADRLYDKKPLSAWHTKDWKLPEAQRRPSEYPLRYSPEEMEKLAADHGYKILRHTLVRARVPRRIYMMQKIA